MRSLSTLANYRAMPLIVVTLLVACGGNADTPAARLFDSVEAQLPPADAAAITALFAEIFPPDDEGRFLHPDCGALDPIVEVTDLDGDTVLEAFVRWGNACTSGMAGSSLSLFLKGPDGSYRHELGFPAGSYRVLPGGDGYPDLEIGGPGFCFPLWSWAGAAYEYACSIPQPGGTCPPQADLCPVR